MRWYHYSLAPLPWVLISLLLWGLTSTLGPVDPAAQAAAIDEAMPIDSDSFTVGYEFCRTDPSCR